MDPFSAMAIASGIAQAGTGFSQAVRAKNARKKAERAAEEALTEARKRLEVNVFDALSINKLPYEMELEANNIAAAQATEAARESQRGVAATAGRVQGMQNQATRQVRADLSREMDAIQRMQLGEEQRLRDMGYGLDMQEIAGAQQAAADAQMRQTMGINAGMAGLTSATKEAAKGVELYQKSASVRQMDKLKKAFDAGEFGDASWEDVLKAGGLDALVGLEGNALSEKISQLDPNKIRDARGNIKGVLDYTPSDANQQELILNNQRYPNIYEDPFSNLAGDFAYRPSNTNQPQMNVNQGYPNIYGNMYGWMPQNNIGYYPR